MHVVDASIELIFSMPEIPTPPEDISSSAITAPPVLLAQKKYPLQAPFLHSESDSVEQRDSLTPSRKPTPDRRRSTTGDTAAGSSTNRQQQFDRYRWLPDISRSSDLIPASPLHPAMPSRASLHAVFQPHISTSIHSPTAFEDSDSVRSCAEEDAKANSQPSDTQVLEAETSSDVHRRPTITTGSSAAARSAHSEDSNALDHHLHSLITRLDCSAERTGLNSMPEIGISVSYVGPIMPRPTIPRGDHSIRHLVQKILDSGWTEVLMALAVQFAKRNDQHLVDHGNGKIKLNDNVILFIWHVFPAGVNTPSLNFADKTVYLQCSPTARYKDHKGFDPTMVWHCMVYNMGDGEDKWEHFLAIVNEEDPPSMQLTTFEFIKNQEDILVELSKGTPNVLQGMRECLEIIDWATHKFIVDAFIVVAPYSGQVISNGNAPIFEPLKTCSFDKAKPVRGGMMEVLHVWRRNSDKGDTAVPEASMEWKGARFGNSENKIFDPGICLLQLLCQ